VSGWHSTFLASRDHVAAPCVDAPCNCRRSFSCC
jgi:hypothetical protein